MSPKGNPNTGIARVLKLTLFGEASLAYVPTDKSVKPVLGPGKPLALLAYLSLSPQNTASRNALLDLLWADHTPDAARHALRQCVWYLRQRLGDDAIDVKDGLLRLALPPVCDAEEFSEAIAERGYQRAVSLYAGDFLPDLALPGGAEFERWAEVACRS